MPIHPKNGALEEMASRNSEEPIVMLNLLRFREQAESGLPRPRTLGSSPRRSDAPGPTGIAQAASFCGFPPLARSATSGEDSLDSARNDG